MWNLQEAVSEAEFMECFWNWPLWEGEEKEELGRGRSRAVMQAQRPRPQRVLGQKVDHQNCLTLDGKSWLFLSLPPSIIRCEPSPDGHDLGEVAPYSRCVPWKAWRLEAIPLTFSQQLGLPRRGIWAPISTSTTTNLLTLKNTYHSHITHSYENTRDYLAIH